MRVDKSVIVLFRQMNLFLNRELLDEKLTSSDVLYLALLYEQDGRTQDEMAEAYTVDRAATTRSLQGLEKKGLVRREVDTFDRRIRRVYLTEKAMQYRTAIRRMADDLADALFEGMSEEEVKAFMEQVEAMGAEGAPPEPAPRAPQSAGHREVREARPSRAAKKGSREGLSPIFFLPCRVKGQRPLWGLGQRPNCFSGAQLKGSRQQRRRQRSVPASNFALPQERPPTCFPNNLHIVAPIGATDHPKTKLNGRCRERIRTCRLFSPC